MIPANGAIIVIVVTHGNQAIIVFGVIHVKSAIRVIFVTLLRTGVPRADVSKGVSV